MTQTTTDKHRWTIVVADQEGDTANVTENEHAHLDQLLRLGVRKLVGDHADPGQYDVLIDGTIQEDLGRTLAEAGLHDHSEVLILPKDVSRG